MPVYSQTKIAGAGAEGDRAGANYAVWSNEGNITASDDSDATSGLDGGAVNGDSTEYLEATQFGFSLPSGSTIVGIEVIFERSHSIVGGSDYVKDNEVKLLIAGAQSGDNLSAGLEWADDAEYPGDRLDSFGGGTSLWGLTPSQAQIEAAGFGVSLVAMLNAGGGGNLNDADVDAITITVSYTKDAPPGARRTGSWPVARGFRRRQTSYGR